tara:strand:- start:42 stop:368 length:327 start_codon:yes stop_codon:yes gene_type:complete
MIHKTLENNLNIIIGQNAIDNWKIIDYAKSDWYWFHLKSFPSSHVILCSSNPNQYSINEAANYCKSFTKYKNVPNIKVSYCKIRNIQKTNKPGQVTFISNKQVKNICV